MTLISADQARTQSSAFDLSREQIVEQISSGIQAMSINGGRLACFHFYKSAVSQSELDASVATVAAAGYEVKPIPASQDQFGIQVTW